jgi:hypothetical protein
VGSSNNCPFSEIYFYEEKKISSDMQHQGRKKQQGFPAGTLVTAETKATGRPKTL